MPMQIPFIQTPHGFQQHSGWPGVWLPLTLPSQPVFFSYPGWGPHSRLQLFSQLWTGHKHFPLAPHQIVAESKSSLASAREEFTHSGCSERGYRRSLIFTNFESWLFYQIVHLNCLQSNSDGKIEKGPLNSRRSLRNISTRKEMKPDILAGLSTLVNLSTLKSMPFLMYT